MTKEAMKERATDVFNSIDDIIEELKEVKDIASKMKDSDDEILIAAMNPNLTYKLDDIGDSVNRLVI